MVDIPFAVFNARTLLGIVFISYRILSWEISCHIWRNKTKSSGLVDGFIFFLRMFRSNMPHRFSIGFISGDLLGHGSLLISFWRNQFCVALAEWQGAPSSINKESNLFILPLENIDRSPSCNIWNIFRRVDVSFSLHQVWMALNPIQYWDIDFKNIFNFVSAYNNID